MREPKLRYNYVIIGAGKYYLIGYRDVISLPSVSFHESHKDGFNSWIERQLLRYNFSRAVNKIVKTPFARFVYPRLFPHQFPDDKPLCFFFFSNSNPLVLNSSYLKYLRKTYQDVRLVLFYQDLVASKPMLDIQQMKEKMDLIVSYDEGDCKRYDLMFHPTPMSFVEVAENDKLAQSDFYFCGYAKTRYPIVHEIYLKLVENGYKCDFNLLGMPEGVQLIPGIHYIEKPLSYMENLQHVVKSKCIVEIMQKGADGFTPRLWESIMYNRHLLTNNHSIWNSQFYQENLIHAISDIDDNNVSWIREPAIYSFEKKQSLSPIHLLKFIDNNLK